MGHRLNRHIIDETVPDPKTELCWRNHHDSLYSRMGENAERQVKKVLANITRQTSPSLEFKPEVRKVKIWYIVDADRP